MSISTSLRKALFTYSLMFLILVFFTISPVTSHAYELLIGTGKTGSFSHFSGKTVCRAIQKFDDKLTCRTVPSDNYTDNMTSVLGGSLDMALVNSKMIYDAFHGAGHYQFITFDYGQLRLLMPLYRMPISLLVRQDAKISQSADLAGKRVNGGAPFSLQSLIFKEIMNTEGWQINSFSLFQELSAANAQDYFALNNGFVQAMLHIGMHPDRKIALGLKNGNLNIIGLSGQSAEKLIDANSGFYKQTIPSGSYPGHQHDIETLALETLLITSSDTDDETANLILDAIYAAKKQLQYTHPAFLQQKTTVETLNNSYLHPHPSAVLFFQTNQNRF